MGRKLSSYETACSVLISSSQVLILLLVDVLCVSGRSLHTNVQNSSSTHLRDSSDGTGSAEFWSKALPGLTLPPAVAARFSPLNPADIHRFSTQLKRGSSFHAIISSKEFCSQANLLCDRNISLLVASGTVFLGAQDHLPSSDFTACSTQSDHEARHSLALASGLSSHVFFPQQELRVGGHITLPDLIDPAPMKAFLPQSLAENLPFHCDTLPELLEIFNISKRSNMSFDMAMVLKACEVPASEGQFKKCITSMEAMVDLVTSILGKDLELLSQPSTAGAKQSVRVIAVKDSESPSAPVSCHSLVFPFAVYYCHYLEGTRVFHLTMQAANGEIMRRAAVCHSWMPSLRDEFMALKLDAHEAACHWLYASNLLWLAM